MGDEFLMRERSMAEHDLIQCGDHKWAPWSIVCTHLVSGDSREWVPVPSTNPEVEYDWLCPDCVRTHEDVVGGDNDAEDELLPKLKAICIHCVRELRRQFDKSTA
jgi:hypothetical protein